MKASRTCIAAALLLACLSAVARATFTCHSPRLYNKGLREMEELARGMGMPDRQVQCLMRRARSLEPVRKEISKGRWVDCIQPRRVGKHLIAALADCIPDLRRGGVRSSARERVRLVRRRVTPDSPLRTLAHWVGLEETVRTPDFCSCSSGCHGCCILSGLADDDQPCWNDFCGGQENGYCE